MCLQSNRRHRDACLHSIAYLDHLLVRCIESELGPTENVNLLHRQWQPCFGTTFPTQSLVHPPVSHSMYATAAARGDGLLLLCGGRDAGGTPMGDAYGFARHRDGRWEWHAAPGQMPTGRYQHGAIFVGNRLHISGGAVGGGRMVSAVSVHLPVCLTLSVTVLQCEAYGFCASPSVVSGNQRRCVGRWQGISVLAGRSISDFDFLFRFSVLLSPQIDSE